MEADNSDKAITSAETLKREGESGVVFRRIVGLVGHYVGGPLLALFSFLLDATQMVDAANKIVDAIKLLIPGNNRVVNDGGSGGSNGEVARKGISTKKDVNAEEDVCVAVAPEVGANKTGIDGKSVKAKKDVKVTMNKGAGGNATGISVEEDVTAGRSINVSI